LASPSLGRISKANKLFQLVTKILYMVTKHLVTSHLGICSGAIGRIFLMVGKFMPKVHLLIPSIPHSQNG
jgi:hypothetical protein